MGYFYVHKEEANIFLGKLFGLYIQSLFQS